MQVSEELPGAATAVHAAANAVTPRSDFIASLCWIVFGVAVTIGSWQMDRLEDQDVNPYTVPGLLPFFLGLAVIFFGLLMLARSLRQGALAKDAVRAVGMTPAERKRFLLVLGLCLTFGIGLVGHGIPFWLAAAVFVSAAITVLQYPQRRAANEVKRGIMIAIGIGLCAGIAITLVFQELFLVRLP